MAAGLGFGDGASDACKRCKRTKHTLEHCESASQCVILGKKEEAGSVEASAKLLCTPRNSNSY